MVVPVAAHETVRAIEQICSLDLDSRALRARIADRLGQAVAYDAFCFGTMDPWTLLLTDDVSAGVPADGYAVAAHNEYLVPDVDKFSALAGSARRVSILSQATGGEPERSHQFRSVLPLLEARHELRAAFVADQHCWGAIALFRGGGRPDFSTAESNLVQALSGPIAVALRRAAGRPGAGVGITADPAGPGVLVLDPNGGLLISNDTGRQWLDDLSPRHLAVHGVAAAVRAGQGKRARVRLRSRSDRWLTLWGSTVNDGDGICVVIEPAPTSDIAQMLMVVHMLSTRERDVLQHVIAGAPSAQIARQLYMSGHTVQDHLKSIFAKVGVRSRGQLVSHILDQRA